MVFTVDTSSWWPARAERRACDPRNPEGEVLGLRRDGFEGREIGSRPARREEPRYHTPPFILAPVSTRRVFIRKSPTRLSPSSRPDGCPGCSLGVRLRFRRRWLCRRTPQRDAAIPASTYWSY